VSCLSITRSDQQKLEMHLRDAPTTCRISGWTKMIWVFAGCKARPHRGDIYTASSVIDASGPRV
jgi:hypothetical protein